MKPLYAKLSPTDTAFLLRVIRLYLSARPAFHAFIRPTEAWLFYRHRDKLRTPVLDFGCGDGFFAQAAFPPGSLDVGLDLPDSRLGEASGRSIYRRLETYPGLNLPFQDTTFATLVSNCVFEHLPHLDHNLLEMRRVLKPGGYLLTTVMTAAWDRGLLGARLLGDRYRLYLKRRQAHSHLHVASHWPAVFRRAGFRVIATRGYLHPQAAHLNELFHYLSWPTLLSYRLFRRWVLLPHWYLPVRFDRLVLWVIRRDLNLPLRQAAGLFFVLQKPPN